MKFPKVEGADIKSAAEVSRFMQDLYKIDMNRYDEALRHGMPFGDMAYGMALNDWIKRGKPKNSIFSYADNEQECKLLMAFKDEIFEKFGLPILNKEDAKLWRQVQSKIVNHNVDWGTN